MADPVDVGQPYLSLPATLEMERSLAALAVELPGEVWEDVRDRWHAARDALVASYEAKVQDFAVETRRSSSLRAALYRTLTQVLLGLQTGTPPLVDGIFFGEGYPPDEVEQLRASVSEEEWAVLSTCRLADFGVTPALLEGWRKQHHAAVLAREADRG